jgi:Family of unknown function (DUF6496)
MAKYGRSASKNVESTMRRRKERDAEERLWPQSEERKQAIAIALNEARKKGAKVPRRKSSRSSKKR